METDELRKILSELYAFEPSLQAQESLLISLLNKLGGLKPDTKFDAAFAARLKAEIMKLAAASSKLASDKKTNNYFNFNFMDRKLYWAFGSLAVASLAFIFFMKASLPNRETQILISKNNQPSAEMVSVLPAGAFGSLASLNSATTNNDLVGKTATLGLGGGGGNVASAERVAFSATSADASSLAAVSPMAGVTTDMKIMPPYYGFKYVYKGEALSLEDTSGAVYRRLKGDETTAKSLAGLVAGQNLAGLDFSAFSNLKMVNMTLAEDKNLGLMISFDFNESNLNIYENWEKWSYPERDACGNDQACWDRYRLKISDVPADADLITMADKFLGDHAVNLEHYGSPVVDNYWRANYESTTDKTNFYIPEYATVIYPLLIDGQAVRDQSGNYAGLRVTINLNKKAASGLSGLMPYRYESSKYDLETSSDAIIKLAENGGWNGNYYIQAENVKTIELGTPEKAYTQIFRYTNNRNEELLVPALIFPVINIPDGVNYYGQRYIVVPLVKEMLQDLGNQPVPLYRMMEGGAGVSGSSAGSAAEGSVPASEPVTGTTESVPPIAPASSGLMMR